MALNISSTLLFQFFLWLGYLFDSCMDGKIHGVFKSCYNWTFQRCARWEAHLNLIAVLKCHLSKVDNVSQSLIMVIYCRIKQLLLNDILWFTQWTREGLSIAPIRKACHFSCQQVWHQVEIWRFLLHINIWRTPREAKRLFKTKQIFIVMVNDQH